MILNAFGKIVEHQWRHIARFFPNSTVDEFMVMPGHFHGIVVMHAGRRESIVGVKHPGRNSVENLNNGSVLSIITTMSSGTARNGSASVNTSGVIP
jgi:hypothetical protein